ncbi:MAG: zinc ribbon domain-containing protein [Desulfarculaceae bacterium]|jgi:putative FmdB family regulatory protein
MPIYEFRCESCSQVFEHLALGSQDKLEIACPHCGGQELSRVLSTCASIVDAKPASNQSGAQVQERNCAGSGSCTTVTLPGYGD